MGKGSACLGLENDVLRYLKLRVKLECRFAYPVGI